MTDWENALKDFTTLIHLFPEKMEYYFKRAECYFHLTKYEKSLSDFLEDQKKDKNYPETNKKLSEIYTIFSSQQLELKSYNRVVGFSKKAIELSSNSATAYFNRGLANLFRITQTEERIKKKKKDVVVAVAVASNSFPIIARP